ncbi:VrrA/YqfQ family protein [Lysinibacillus telephonicus]|uniref:VrrA/YqfQ family protein n=1 Tax=Lysinibacillus telephonicus TaxID=1714840 RepID=UPI003B9F02CF
MRPQSFRPPMPQGRPFNSFPGPMQNFGYQQPPQFPPNMGPGIMQGVTQGMQGIQGMQGMTQGGLPTRGSTPKLDSFMETANRFLSTAQSFQPLIQQATPMFRNLPAIWKLYKGFQSLPKSQGSQEPSRKSEKTSTSVKSKDKYRPEPLTTRPSVPRIYQPPYNID